jgi:hypothetical protein
MQTLDRPTLTTVQSFVLLAMYWFGIGEPGRANIHTGIASRVVQNLGFNQALESDGVWVEQELKIRAFWVSWLMELFGSLTPGQVHPLVVQAIVVPLPCSEEELVCRTRAATVCRLHDTTGSESVLGELMKAANIW